MTLAEDGERKPEDRVIKVHHDSMDRNENLTAKRKRKFIEL